LISPANATLEQAAAITATTKTDFLMKKLLVNGEPTPPDTSKVEPQFVGFN
jgi:hypothetical protein